jgi:hypothetical protein
MSKLLRVAQYESLRQERMKAGGTLNLGNESNLDDDGTMVIYCDIQMGIVRNDTDSIRSWLAEINLCKTVLILSSFPPRIVLKAFRLRH